MASSSPAKAAVWRFLVRFIRRTSWRSILHGWGAVQGPLKHNFHLVHPQFQNCFGSHVAVTSTPHIENKPNFADAAMGRIAQGMKVLAKESLLVVRYPKGKQAQHFLVVLILFTNLLQEPLGVHLQSRNHGIWWSKHKYYHFQMSILTTWQEDTHWRMTPPVTLSLMTSPLRSSSLLIFSLMSSKVIQKQRLGSISSCVDLCVT